MTTPDSWLALGVSVGRNPIVHGGRMIVGSIDGGVHAIDIASASVVWSTRVKGTSVRGVGAAGDVILATVQWGGVSAGRGIVVGLDAQSGAVLWQERADAAIGTAPCIVEQMVLYGTQETGLKAKSGMLSARDIATGALLWTRGSPAFEHELHVIDGALIGAAGEGALYCIDLETGSTRWRVATGKFFTGGPAIADGVAYIGGHDGVVYATGLEEGAARWRFRRGHHPFVATPFVANGLVHIGSWDESLYALDSLTGKEVWRRPLRAMAMSQPTPFHDRVCVGCSDQTLHAFDAHTGHRAWRWKGPHESWNSGIGARPLLHDERLFVFASSGELYVLDAATGHAFAPPHEARPPQRKTHVKGRATQPAIRTEEEIGMMSVPSGRVVACDPIVEPVTRPLDRTVPKGLHRVVVGLETSAAERLVMYLELRVRDTAVARWQAPRRGVRTVGVDSAHAAVMSLEAAATLVSDPEAVNALAPLFGTPPMTQRHYSPWALVSIGGGDIADTAVCSSGHGDGEYAILYGLDPANRLVRIRLCFIPPDGVSG